MRTAIWMTIAATLVLSACAPGGQSGTSRADSAGDAPRQSRTLVMAARYEPASLASRPLRESGSGVSSTTRLFNAELDMEDGRASTRPYLAEALPQLNTDSWRVLPDGRMETSYKLKPNITWHDGTALSAEDFVFAWQVFTAAPLAPPGGPPIEQMEDVTAPDASSVVIRWRQLYPEAGALAANFQALPRHILAAPFERLDPDAFLSHPYWSTEYVGMGPYRLDRWEQGALITGSAFDGHILGRPKIDRIVMRFFSDENVAFTNVLAGEVHYATGRSLRFEHGSGLRREWAAEKKGTVLFTPDTARFIALQFRPEVVGQRALANDVRVRRGIVHSVDRQLLNEGIFDGDHEMSDTFYTRFSRYERVHDVDRALSEADRAITHYPFDPRRSEQLMGEAGFAKDRDGFFASPTGERFGLEVWTHTSPQYDKEVAILADTWQRAGFDIKPTLLSAAALRDNQLRSSFTGLYIASSSRLESFATASIPTQTNRWVGGNRGGWVNQEYDRLWQQFNGTLDGSQRIGQMVQMLKILSDEVPALVLYYNPSVAAHLAMLQGPDSASLNTDVWNVHEWEMK